MRAAAVFLGDELSAAGFRLGGAVTHTPRPGEEASAFEWALQQAPLVLVTAGVADRIPPGHLSRALSAGMPMVMVMSDIRQREKPADIAQALRHQLGTDI